MNQNRKEKKLWFLDLPEWYEMQMGDQGLTLRHPEYGDDYLFDGNWEN